MRHLSVSNVIASVALFFAISGGAVYAAGKIGSNKIKPNAILSKHIRADQATGDDVLESSLGPVPQAQNATSAQNAATVGGVALEPLRVAVSDPAGVLVTILTVAGNTVAVGCQGGNAVQALADRSPSGPPLYYEKLQATVNPVIQNLTPGASLSQTAVGAARWRFTIREASGRVTNLDMSAFYEINAFGGPEDCFYQGIIERSG